MDALPLPLTILDFPWAALPVDRQVLAGTLCGFLLGTLIMLGINLKQGRKARMQMRQMLDETVETRNQVQRAQALYFAQCGANKKLKATMDRAEADHKIALKNWQDAASQLRKERDASYAAYRAGEDRYRNLQADAGVKVSAWNNHIADLTREKEASAELVNRMTERLAGAQADLERDREKYEGDLREAHATICALKGELSAQEQEAQDTFEANRLATLALDEELQSAKQGARVQSQLLHALYLDVARYWQAHEDLKGSLDFALKEQHFAAHMYEGEVARLRMELTQTDEACEDLSAELRSVEHQLEELEPLDRQPPEYADAGCQASEDTTDIDDLVAERDAAAAQLEDLASSMLAVLQAYKEVQADRDSLSVQLHHLRQLCSHCQSPTPGLGFAFPLPLDCSSSRSPSASPLLATPQLGQEASMPLGFAGDKGIGGRSPDVFGPPGNAPDLSYD